MLNEIVRAGAMQVKDVHITVGLLAAAILIFLIAKKLTKNIVVFIVAFALSSGCLSGSIMTFLFSQREQIEQYFVTIDESVDLAEFEQFYKIIEQNGLIYTIEEREP